MKKLALLLMLSAAAVIADCTYVPGFANVCCVSGDPVPTDVFVCEVFADGRSYCYQQYDCPPLEY